MSPGSKGSTIDLADVAPMTPEPAAHATRTGGAAPLRPGRRARRPRTPLSHSVRLASLLPVAALVAVAGWGFHRVFGLSALTPTVAVATALPILLAALLSGRRRPDSRVPLWPSVTLSVVCWLVVVSVTLFRADAAGPVPTSASLRHATGGLLDAWKSILTTIPPAPERPELLVLVHACLWAAAFAGAELALRTRTRVLPALPAVAAYGVALLLGARVGGWDAGVVAALVAGAGVLMLLRSPSLSGRVLLTGLPYLACLALLAAVAGPRLPFADARAPYDPGKGLRQPAPIAPQAVNPLDLVSAWLLAPERPLFRATTAGEANWRLVVLDDFDGTTWSPTAQLVRSGGRVPAATAHQAQTTTRLEARITVQDLTGVWLPAADRPNSVSRTSGSTVGDLAVDPASGMVAVSRSLRTGLSYRVVSEVPHYAAQELQHAPVAADAAARAETVLPAAPDGTPVRSLDTMRQLARTATAGSTFPFQQAVRLADWLRGNYTNDPRAVPGHAYRNVEFFLETTRRGTSEHFATAFAIMARTLGLPTRVVVGFRPGTRDGGDWQVRTGDVLVWPEVQFAGVGWVPFFPTPDQAAGQSAKAAAPAGEPPDRRQIDDQVAEGGGSNAPPKPAAVTRPAPSADGGGVPWWAIALGGAVVLLAGYAAIMLLAPWRRRRRRRQAQQAAQRVMGAWAQALERLRDVGLPSGGALTAAEVAAFGAERLGPGAAEHLDALGRMANGVVFGGLEPVPATADDAWRHCAAVEADVDRVLTRRARLRLRLYPIRPAAGAPA